MRRRKIWRRVDGCTELRNGAIEIPCVKKPSPGVCGEERRLLARLLSCDFRSQSAFRRRAFGVSELTEHGRQSCVSASEIRLQPDGFPQSRRRILKLALLLQNRPQGVIRFGIIRLSANRCAEFLSGSGKISLLPECYSQRVMDIGLGGIQFRGFAHL